MSVAKKRISKRRTRARRSHHGLKAQSTATCEKCGTTLRPHRACTECGTYRGKDVLGNAKKVEQKIAKAAPKKEADSK
jgi:large subunit ribosomal protein L32